MLISLLSLLAATVSAELRASLADGPIVLEGPTTLELGLIGGGVILAYALATRLIRRRPANARAHQLPLDISNEAPRDAQCAADAIEPPGEQPSRGAA
jgi:hypothetical protein